MHQCHMQKAVIVFPTICDIEDELYVAIFTRIIGVCYAGQRSSKTLICSDRPGVGGQVTFLSQGLALPNVLMK